MTGRKDLIDSIKNFKLSDDQSPQPQKPQEPTLRDELAEAITDGFLRKVGQHPEQIERRKDKEDAENWRVAKAIAPLVEAIKTIPKRAAKKPKLPPLPPEWDVQEVLFGAKLTERELEIYEMRFGREMRVTAIKNYFGCHHSTIQEHLEKAKKKINEAAARGGVRRRFTRNTRSDHEDE